MTMHPLTQRHVMVVAVIMCSLLALFAALVLPAAVDWHATFYPVAQVVVRGQSPYEVDGFFNPPWTVLAFLPFAAQEQLGRGAWFMVSLIVLMLIAVHAGASPFLLALWLLSPPVWHSLLFGNLEWLVLAGVFLPPRWGLFVIAIKPQVAWGVGALWIWEAWQDGGWQALVRLVWPVALALGVSVAWFGLWPLRALSRPSVTWNASLWPWSILAGAPLLLWGLVRRDWRYALAASPMLSPYVALYSWTGAVLATLGNWRVALLVIALQWGLVLRIAL